MAHHVQKKATKKHAATRPKKSRPSDKFRAPTNYPPVPEQAWMTKIDALSPSNKVTVTITVSPDDTPASLTTKLTAAGATAPAEFMYSGSPLTTTLADCGL